MSGTRSPRVRRARLVPVALTTAALCSALLGAAATGSLSAFEASITNASNTAESGSLVMKELDANGDVVCSSSDGANNVSASCTGVDEYGGTGNPFTPGSTHATTIYIGNVGSSEVRSFAVKPGDCSRTAGPGTGSRATGDLCARLQLTLSCTPVRPDGTPTASSVTVYPGRTLSEIANAEVDLGSISAGCVPHASGANGVRLDFSVHMPDDQDNTVQGQTASQPITWTFTGA